MTTTQWTLASRIGPLHLTATATELTGVYWRRQDVPMASRLTGVLAQAARELTEYLAGERRTFDVATASSGTPFQESVWRQLRRIPYGATRSYRDLAVAIANEGAVRAVGTANGRNPLSIIVPCHRVITSGGKLGGFAGGLAIKERLLALELGVIRRGSA